MIIDLITNHLINYNKDKINPFIIFVDEVHRYTKSNTNDGISFYTGLNSILPEKEKKGIFLLTTQNPNDVDKVLLGQIGDLLVHRLTVPNELKIIQNHLSENHKST